MWSRSLGGAARDLGRVPPEKSKFAPELWPKLFEIWTQNYPNNSELFESSGITGPELLECLRNEEGFNNKRAFELMFCIFLRRAENSIEINDIWKAFALDGVRDIKDSVRKSPYALAFVDGQDKSQTGAGDKMLAAYEECLEMMLKLVQKTRNDPQAYAEAIRAGHKRSADAIISVGNVAEGSGAGRGGTSSATESGTAGGNGQDHRNDT
ncbi:uncharacterized protein PAC_19674 [Phialocephala subalpina]|uniref:Uncharacterized protein n=1 Tax=Phialocephala subalpina TaxID=576137 RepID=A0A1L7XXP4_9HELO|nr:uncharacterized protein PAC_19674 [Phialocephala subalpina]